MESNYNSLSLIRRYTTIFLFLSILLECIFFPSPENMFGCFAEMYGWLLISYTVFKWEYLYKHFIPFVMLFCLGYYFFVLPIPVTLIESKPLTFRFNVPYLTFFNLILNVTTIVAAFHFTRFIYREGWLTRLWGALGYFRAPTEKQIWVFSILGLGALIWNVGAQGDEVDIKDVGAIGQFLYVFRQYAYMPLALLFVKYWDVEKQSVKSKKIILCYFIVLSIVAIASTRRMILMNMAVSWGVMSLFIAIYNNKKLFSGKSMLYFVVAFYLLTGPIADLATAMIINRKFSQSNSASSTLSNVWVLYSDKELLHEAYQKGTFSNTDNKGANYSMWSEYYIDNVFFDRFCNLRTQDITLDYAHKLGYNSKKMNDYANSFLLFQVPTPILRVFGYEGNKFDNYYTPGDLLSTAALGLRNQYAGFRVCGDSAVGLSWMGYSYYIFAFFIYVLLFYFLSSLVSTSYGGLLIPIPVIVSMTVYMAYFNNATGIFKTISLLLRGGWQNIVIYCVIMGVLRKIIK